MKKSIPLFAVLIFLSGQSFSQCAGLAIGGGGIYDDGSSYGVTTDGAGNIYFCGSYADTARFGTQVLTSDSITDQGYFFNKYDSQGNLLWSHSLGNISATFGFKPIVMSGNEIYITCGASYFQQGTDTVNSGQIVLWKLDTSGNLLWRRNYPASYYFTYSLSIIPDGSGGVYITGRFRDSLTVNPVLLTAPNTGKAWIAHINSNGNTVWAKQAAPTVFTNRGNDVVQLSNGNIAITGYYLDSLQFDNHILTESPASTDGLSKFKPYVALFDSSGNNLWIKGFTTAGQIIHSYFDCGYGIGKDVSDNIYITGSLSDSTRIGGTLVDADSGHAFLAKFSPAGSIQWLKIFGADNNMNWGTSVFNDNQHIFIVGNYSGAGRFGNVTDSAAGTDVFVAKADLNGNILSHLRTRGDTYENTYQSYLTNSGDLIVAGYYRSHTADFPFAGTLINSDPAATGVTGDPFFWKVCSSDLVSVKEQQTTMNLISIFPNPAVNQCTISFSKNNKNLLVTISDITGKIIYGITEAENEKTEVSTKEFTDGIYFVRVQSEDFIETYKLIVEK